MAGAQGQKVLLEVDLVPTTLKNLVAVTHTMFIKSHVLRLRMKNNKMKYNHMGY